MKVYIYHKELMKNKETDILIGVCSVDTTIYGIVEDMNLIEGYYKLCKIDTDDSCLKTEDDDLGIIKIKVNLVQNFKELEIQKSSEYFDDAKNLQDVYETLKQIRGEEQTEEIDMPQETIMKEYDGKMEEFAEELSDEDAETLMQRHMQNLKDLEQISKQLKGEQKAEEVEDFSSNYKPSESLQKDEINNREINTDSIMPESQASVKIPDPEFKKSNIFEKNLFNMVNPADKHEEEKKVILSQEPALAAQQQLFTSEEKEIQPEEVVVPTVKEEEAQIQEKVKTISTPINRKRLLTTPHKKPPLPQHLSTSIKNITDSELKNVELDRISKIMRSTVAGNAKKSGIYSSDSDT